MRDDPAAGAVGELLAEPTLLTAVNAAGVLDQRVRVYGSDAEDVHADLALLAHTGMQRGTISAEVGGLAGRLRARHHHRGRMAVSLADCVDAAAALSAGRPLATADPALAKLIRGEGGDVRALPDTHGRLM